MAHSVIAILIILSLSIVCQSLRIATLPRTHRLGQYYSNPFRAPSQLYIFGNLFNNNNKNLNKIPSQAPGGPATVTPVAGKVADKEKLQSMKQNLAKISNTQQRDYAAEALANAKPAPVITDKQPVSYNWNKPNEFPNLYKGWLKKDGDQIAKQIITATRTAINKDKLKYVEILFDPVPNLDEVAFGTTWNQRFRKEDVVPTLQVPEYVTNRGGPSTLEWSNLYWMNRLVEGINPKRTLVLSLSGEGLNSKQGIPVLHKSVTLMRYQDAVKSVNNLVDKPDLIVLLSPCQEIHYTNLVKLGDQFNAPVVALNSPYSYRYDIGGSTNFELIYVMKRVPKGWVYRNYPKPFEVILEGPNYDIVQASVFPKGKRPSLVEVSKISMQVSTERYGAVGNDRIFEQRL